MFIGGIVAHYKTSSMEGRVSLFRSGKMISVGTKSEEKAGQELEAAMVFLAAKGFIERVKLDPKIQNLVAMVDFEKELSLEELAQRLTGIYEPEQFPGIILRIKRPFKASILLFDSGKAVIAGLKASSQIRPVVKKLLQETKPGLV